MLSFGLKELKIKINIYFIDPLEAIMTGMTERRSRQKVLEKALSLGLIQDKKELYKKRKGKSKKKHDEWEEGAEFTRDEGRLKLSYTLVKHRHVSREEGQAKKFNYAYLLRHCPGRKGGRSGQNLNNYMFLRYCRHHFQPSTSKMFVNWCLSILKFTDFTENHLIIHTFSKNKNS